MLEKRVGALSAPGTPRQSICFVLTSTFTLNVFMLNHLRALSDRYSVVVCVNTSEPKISDRIDPRVKILHFPITRKISPFRDFYALVWLFFLFRTQRFEAVHSVTPKGGLLSMIAAWAVGIRHRTHIFTGQVWANRGGAVRLLLKNMDRLTAYFSTSILADSRSQVDFLCKEKVCRPGAVKVLGRGSISGVDLERFSSTPARQQLTRAELGIPENAVVFLFLGRIHHDKGVLELAKAFSRVSEFFPQAWLLYVGPDESGLSTELSETCGDRCVILGLTDTPEKYIDSSDVLCLPSYREGFGTVVIEAAAMGLPAIVSKIYGLTDAIEENVSGLTVTPADVESLQAALIAMLDPALREKMGRAARERAKAEFSAERITGLWVDYYNTVLGSKVSQ